MRYFFDIRYGDTVLRDEEGQELRTLDEVEEEAAASLMDALRYPEHPGVAHHVSIEVRDERGLVAEVTYSFEHHGQLN
jgi:hypothetical protein